MAALFLAAIAAPAVRAELTFTGYDSLFEKHVYTFFRGYQTEGVATYRLRPTTTSEAVTCTGTNFTGISETGESKTITGSVSVAPTCSFTLGGYKTDVNMNGCDYRFNLTKKINEHKYEGTVDVQCSTKGNAIEFQATRAEADGGGVFCTLKIEEQNGLGPVYYENITPSEALKYVVVKVQATNVNSITEAKSGKAKDCGVDKLGTHTAGTLTYEAQVLGTGTGEEALEVTVSG